MEDLIKVYRVDKQGLQATITWVSVRDEKDRETRLHFSANRYFRTFEEAKEELLQYMDDFHYRVEIKCGELEELTEDKIDGL